MSSKQTDEESYPLLAVQDDTKRQKIAEDTKKVHGYIYFGELRKLREFLATFEGFLHELKDPDDGYTPLHFTTFSGQFAARFIGGLDWCKWRILPVCRFWEQLLACCICFMFPHSCRRLRRCQKSTQRPLNAETFGDGAAQLRQETE